MAISAETFYPAGQSVTQATVPTIPFQQFGQSDPLTNYLKTLIGQRSEDRARAIKWAEQDRLEAKRARNRARGEAKEEKAFQRRQYFQNEAPTKRERLRALRSQGAYEDMLRAADIRGPQVALQPTGYGWREVELENTLPWSMRPKTTQILGGGGGGNMGGMMPTRVAQPKIAYEERPDWWGTGTTDPVAQAGELMRRAYTRGLESRQQRGG